MSWRTVVITKTAKLDYSLGYMVVRDVENTSKIHISEISVLIIESTSVSLTAYLLNELIKSKVKVIFCDEKRNPSFEINAYYGSHDCSLKVKRQIGWDELALNQNSAKLIVDNLKKIKPQKGLVQVLCITEKQFQKMDIIVGNIYSNVVDSDERLVIL